ncbi:MAG: DUF3806 domain-containing protein [Myxococcota bacterium]
MEHSQTVSAPDADELARMEARRASVHAYLAPESRASLETPAGKLGLIRALLAAGVFRPAQTAELQSLGIVLGDALVQHVEGGEWVTVEDEYGRDPAVRIRGTTVLLFPLTMISKRVEAGEPVDVFALFNGLLDHIDDLRTRADGGAP